MDGEQLYRTILEMIKTLAPRGESVSVSKVEDHLAGEISFPSERWRFERLEEEDFINITGRNLGGGFSVALKPKGFERLASPEPAPVTHPHGSPSVTQFHNTFHGDIGTVAQTTGSHSPIAINSGSDLAQIAKLLGQVLAEIRENRTATPEEKSDAEITTKQIELEVRKSNRNLELLKVGFETLKVFAPIAIAELKRHLGLPPV